MAQGKGVSVNMRLNTLVLVSFVPFTVMIVYLLLMMNRFSQRYDVSVESITMANDYSVDFKEKLDYTMYIIVVNSERAEELVDTDQPQQLIYEARDVFRHLNAKARDEEARIRLKRIIKSLNALEGQVEEIQANAQISGMYDTNMERLDLDIRVMTELIQEQIQEYIYYEAANLETIREGIRTDVENAIMATILIFLAILAISLFISRRITASITKPVQKLCEATRKAGKGDFAVRTLQIAPGEAERMKESQDELAVLNASFNHMMEKIGTLVEDIRVEQLKLRAAELNLLQAQINPHFLYNTLDAIIWLAESGQKEQVITMVSALSDFFRTTLSKGKDFISIQEEETHIRSYLQIQQFRYRDILEYEISISQELYQYQILKLTLQPLVENALYHGIKNKRGVGRIEVKGYQESGVLVLSVQDNGIGMDAEQLEKVRRGIKKGTIEPRDSGFGLYNVEQRIQLYYGTEYGLQVESTYGEGTKVHITIPAVSIVKN